MKYFKDESFQFPTAGKYRLGSSISYKYPQYKYQHWGKPNIYQFSRNLVTRLVRSLSRKSVLVSSTDFKKVSFNLRLGQNGINLAINNLSECFSQGHRKRLPMASIIWEKSLKTPKLQPIHSSVYFLKLSYFSILHTKKTLEKPLLQKKEILRANSVANWKWAEFISCQCQSR